jgi:hypothetical protein
MDQPEDMGAELPQDAGPLKEKGRRATGPDDRLQHTLVAVRGAALLFLALS